jgi:hypothetical protein
VQFLKSSKSIKFHDSHVFFARMEGAINNMDSIGRPTSKVIAPPGGVSSNIFGTDPEPPKKNNARNKKNESSIFGGPEPVQAPKPVQKVVAAPEAAVAKETPKPASESAPAQVHDSNSKYPKRTQNSQKTTSIKVHAPPGGKSSIFFG